MSVTQRARTILRCISLLFVLSIFIAVPTFAGNLNAGVSCPEQTETYIALFDACLSFGKTVSLTVSWALLIGTVVALVKLAIGAVQFIFSTGDPGKLTNARSTLTDAFLGLILIASAWVIFTYLAATFPKQWGINLVFFDLP